MSDDWPQVETLVGEEYATTYRGHYLDIRREDPIGWSWSMTHPLLCNQRGAAGVMKTQRTAQAAARKAVDRLRCEGMR